MLDPLRVRIARIAATTTPRAGLTVADVLAPILGALDVDALAAEIDGNASRLAGALLADETERGAVLASPFLASRWPLDAAFAVQWDDAAARLALAAVAHLRWHCEADAPGAAYSFVPAAPPAAVSRAWRSFGWGRALQVIAEELDGRTVEETPGDGWPTATTPGAVADLLEGAGEVDASLLAVAVRDHYFAPPPPDAFSVDRLNHHRWLRAHEDRLAPARWRFPILAVALLAAVRADLTAPAPVLPAGHVEAFYAARAALQGLTKATVQPIAAKFVGDIARAADEDRARALLANPARRIPHHLAGDLRAPESLAAVILHHLPPMVRAIGLGAHEPTPAAIAALLPGPTGILAVDEHFAGLVERIGVTDGGNHPVAVQQSAIIRAKAAERAERWRADGDAPGLWAPWIDPAGPRCVRILARVFWEAMGAPKVLGQAGLTHGVNGTMAFLNSKGIAATGAPGGFALCPSRLPPDRVFDVALRPVDGVATIDGPRVAAAIERLPKLLGGLTAHKLVQWLVKEGHGRTVRGEQRPDRITISGGWSGLAEELGLSSTKDRDDVRDIARILALCYVQVPGWDGTLLMIGHSQASGHERAEVAITLNEPLLPKFTELLGRTLPKGGATAGRERRIVPAIGIPPLVGRANEHGQQVMFSMLLMSHLRENAVQMVTEGGVWIPDDAIDAMARQAGLPLAGKASGRGMIDRWLHDGDDAPALLEATGRNASRVVMAKGYAGAQAFLEDGADRTIMGRRGGLEASARRLNPRRGKGRRGEK